MKIAVKVVQTAKPSARAAPEAAEGPRCTRQQGTCYLIFSTTFMGNIVERPLDRCTPVLLGVQTSGTYLSALPFTSQLRSAMLDIYGTV